MHFANIQMGNFIWGRVYGLGKIGRGKVYDSLQEYSPLPLTFVSSVAFWIITYVSSGTQNGETSFPFKSAHHQKIEYENSRSAKSEFYLL